MPRLRGILLLRPCGDLVLLRIECRAGHDVLRKSTVLPGTRQKTAGFRQNSASTFLWACCPAIARRRSQHWRLVPRGGTMQLCPRLSAAQSRWPGCQPPIRPSRPRHLRQQLTLPAPAGRSEGSHRSHPPHRRRPSGARHPARPHYPYRHDLPLRTGSSPAMTTAVDLSPPGERTTEPEWLIISPPSRFQRRHPWLRRGMLAGILALAVIMITTARVVGSGHEADGLISWNRTSESSHVITDDPQQDQKQPVGYRRWSVMQVGHPLLATKSSWELYAETDREVIKIQPADGRITRMGIPAAPTRPLKSEPVPGRRAQPGLSEPLIRLTTECDTQHHCHGVVIDRRSGDRHNVDLALSNVSPWLATTSPDGQYLAVVYAAVHHPVALHLLDLRRGHDRLTTVQVDQTLHEGSFAWSPDSDYLFVAGVKGRLWVIKPATGAVSEFPATLPPVRELAARPAAR